jgi:hypothetical protein
MQQVENFKDQQVPVPQLLIHQLQQTKQVAFHFREQQVLSVQVLKYQPLQTQQLVGNL